MSRRRASGFTLASAVGDPSFTPRQGDLVGLLELLQTKDEAVARATQRALGRLGPGLLPWAMEHLESLRPPARGRLARLVGRLASNALDLDALERLAADVDPKVRRNAVIAIGKLAVHRGDERLTRAEDALLRYWQGESRADHRRSVAEALGKIGGARSLEYLQLQSSSDPELARVVDKALLMLTRTLGRHAASEIDLTRPPAEPVAVTVHCRSGLEPILADELASLRGRATGPGTVELTLRDPPARLLDARTMLCFGFPLGGRHIASDEKRGVAIADLLTSDRARTIFASWTVGPVKYRIAWWDNGHHRAVTWGAAREVAIRHPDIVNDPTASTWEALVTTQARRLEVELIPKRIEDERFAYRQDEVPASSHPTIAAALARVGGARPQDVVWDPFVGSGLELIERARLGPYRALRGSDRDPRALEAARRNLELAGIRDATLSQADATTAPLEGATLVLTNPPMGRRVLRGQVGPLLDRFVDHVAQGLASGGRLVWMSPLPEQTAARAKAAGLRLVFARQVDMGGFTAELQAFRKGPG